MCYRPTPRRTCEGGPPATEEQRFAAHKYQQAQDLARQVANYRVAWDQDRGGYFAQGRVGEADEWVDLTGNVYSRSHAAAVLDAKLYARNVVGEACRLHPDIANLTERTT